MTTNTVRGQLGVIDDSEMPLKRKTRPCKWREGCITPLGKDNTNDYCWTHLRIMIDRHYEEYEKERKAKSRAQVKASKKQEKARARIKSKQ